MKQKPTIQFILPGAGIAGGIKVVYTYANLLHQRGYPVRIIYPGALFPDTRSLKWKVEAPLRNTKYYLQKLRGFSEGSWYPLEIPLIRKASLEAKYIPDADITIATGNETADWVAKLPARCGTKFYFVQDFEDWLRPVDEVLATYALPLKQITISTFLKKFLAEHSSAPAVATITNAIDTTIFYNTSKKLNTPRRILMLSHYDERKGLTDGFAAIAKVRKQFPDIQLVMFGVEKGRPDMPEGTEFHQRPSIEKLRELYSTSDIFVSSSWKEGCQVPPMEAMACGCAVVATNVGGIPDYAIAGKTALVVEPHQPEELAKAIISLLQDEKLLIKIGEAGQKHIQQFTWKHATDELEKALLENR